MKTLSTFLATSVLLISATAANAAYFEDNISSTLRTDMTDSRATAYQAGLDKLTQLKSASPLELSSELFISAHVDENSVHLNNDSSYVTVQERSLPNGKVGYIGLVNIDLGYTEEHEDDN